MFHNLYEFYRSEEWRLFREVVIAERIHEDGFVYDEVTGKPIVKAYDIILHHKIELTEENVHDYSISLNPDNIMIVSHKTHNIIHNKLGYKVRGVFLVYGAPLSGKSSWVRDNMTEGDFVIDMDSIWQMVSGCPRYVKPPRLKAVVFKTRDTLLDCVKYRLGKWQSAYIIATMPLLAERERLSKELGARLVHIDADEETCLERLKASNDGRGEEYEQYIRDYFRKYELYGVST